MNTGNTVGEYLTNVFTACGVTPEQLNSFLTADTKMDSALPDEVKSKVGDILTMNSARANDSLRGHFRGEVYNGLDAAVDKMVEQFELSDIYNPIKMSETKTTDRISKLLSSIKGSYEGKLEEAAKGQGDEDVLRIRNELESKIKQLNGELASAKKLKDEELSSLTSEHKRHMDDAFLDNFFYAQNYRKDEFVSREQFATLAKMAFQDKLKANGLVLNRDGRNWSVTDKNGSEAFNPDINLPFKFDTLVESVMSDGNYISKKPAQPNGPTVITNNIESNAVGANDFFAKVKKEAGANA